MGFAESNCPHCGKVNRNSCNAWMYDTPIRRCKYCNQKFVDRRYRELAVEGIDQRSANPAFYLKGMAIFFVAGIVLALLLACQIRFLGYYSTRLVACVFICFAGCLMCGLLFVRIKLGIEDKNAQKYFAESEKRLENKAYVQELLDNGYDVPDKYR